MSEKSCRSNSCPHTCPKSCTEEKTTSAATAAEAASTAAGSSAPTAAGSSASSSEAAAEATTSTPPKPVARHIIGIFSGKGGVGKSTISSNLAVTLAQKGYRVGLLDADLFGPSIPKMFGAESERPYSKHIDGRDLIVPVEKYGVKLLSIGFFVDATQPVVWRGGMASNALKQLITETIWGDLDYLLIDLPPGTSDIHLTLVQTITLTGSIVVTTPQPVALADARKGIEMFRNEKINVPIHGLVENMSWFTPAELPQNRYYIFGQNGGRALADELGIPLLAQIPLVQGIREDGDNGTPIALSTDAPQHIFFEELVANLQRTIA